MPQCPRSSPSVCLSNEMLPRLLGVRRRSEQWEMMYPTIRELYRNGTIFGFVLGDELVWSGVEWPMVETAANLLRRDFPGSVIWCAASPR